MGIFKRLFARFKKEKMRILVVGLDNSGKTTMLNYLKPKKATLETVPTVGFSVEEFTKNNIQFSAFDMSGQGRYRDLWTSYYSECQGIVFVIDATDELRFAVAKDELQHLLNAEEIRQRKVPILFFANKMDLPSAAGPIICMNKLGLKYISDIPWHIEASNAIAGVGIEEGVKWLAERVKNG
eukprot:GEMP01066688.1.p1 GENE.GEMP01066688.1~~GEMP01066688.1.p1  ORF type:complete len:182 (+),score=37.67 GEMP01066688.1:256-801(+)